MKLNIYPNYAGTCLQAFRFHEEHLGGRTMSMMTHGEWPGAAHIPAEQRDQILHARFRTSWMLLHEEPWPGQSG